MDQAIRGYLELLEKTPAEAPPLAELERTLSEAQAWDHLVRLYERYLHLQPEDDATRERLVALYRERRDEKGLCELLEREAARAATPEQAADAYCALGESLFTIGREQRAIEMWQRALRLVPTCREALSSSREAYAALCRFEAAQAVIDREVATYPDEAEIHATRYAELGRKALEQPYRHQLARSCADAALALDPGCAAARVLVEAIEALRSGWRDQVRHLKARAVEERDRRAAARLYLQAAALHAAFDESPEAEAVVRESLQPVFLLWPAMPEALEFLERRHGERDDFEGLAAAWERLVEITREREAQVELLLRLASLYEVRFDDAAKATETRRRAASIDPGSAEAVLPLLEQLADEGRSAELAQLLEKHLAASPAASKQPDLRLLLAESWLEEDEYERAQLHLEEALAIDPLCERAEEMLEPLLAAEPEKLGRLLERRAGRTADPDEQVALLLRAASLRPDAAVELLSRALLVAPERQDVVELLEAAAPAATFLQQLRAAADATPQRETRVALLARVARLLENSPSRGGEARDAWQRVLAVDPDHAEAAAAVERLREESADVAERIASLEEKLRDTAGAGERGELLRTLASLCEAHDPARAVVHLQDLVVSEGPDVQLLRRLAAAQAAAERWPEQLQTLNLLVEEGDAEALATRAALLVDRLGRAEEGAADWLRVLERDEAASLPALERLLHAGVAVEAIGAALAPRFEAAGEWTRLATLVEARLAATREPGARHELYLQLATLREERLVDLRGAFTALGRALVERPAELALVGRLEALATTLGAKDELEGLLREAWEGEGEGAALLARHVARSAADEVLVAAAWRGVLAREPADDEALAALAERAAAAGHWAEAGSLLERRLAVAPTGRRGALELIRAGWLTRQGAHGHAVEALRAAAEAGATEEQVLPLQAEALAAAGRQEELVEVIARQEAIAREAGREAEASRLALRKAQLLSALQRKGEAAAHFGAILARDPADAEAIAAIEELLEEPATAVEAAAHLEPAYEKTGRWQELRRVIGIRLGASTDPAFRLASRRRLAQLATRELRDPALAFESLCDAFREAPGDALLRSELRVAAGQAGRLAELAQVMAEVAQGMGANPQAIAVERELAELCEKRLGDGAAAAACHRRILALEERNVEALRALHRLLPGLDAPEERYGICLALAAAVYDGKERVRLWREAAQLAQRELDDPGKAAAALRQVAQAQPDEAQHYVELERLYREQQAWEDCAWALQRQEGPDAACRLAEVKRRHLDDVPGALALLGGVLEQEPAHRHALAALGGWAGSDDAGAREALALLDRALSAAGAHDERVELREAALARATDPARRRALLEEIVAIHEVDAGSPPLAFVAATRAFAELAAGGAEAPDLATLERLAEATGAWEDLVELYEAAVEPLPELLRRIATLREERLDDAAGAVAAWREILAQAPHDDEALEALGRLYAATERAEDLVEILCRRAETAPEGLRRDLLMQAADTCALALEDGERAVALCRRVLELAPGHAPALETLALYLREEDDGAELVQVLGALADGMEPGSEARCAHLLRRISLQAASGAQDEALRDCVLLLEERPAEPQAVAAVEALLAEGLAEAAEVLEPIYRQTGDEERLLTLLERRLNEVEGAERAALLAEMTGLRLATGGAEAAWPLALARFAAAPDDVEAREALFTLADRTGSHEALCDALENALVERPGDRELLLHLASVQEEKLQRREAARATWERVLAFDSADVEALRAVRRLAAAGEAWAVQHEMALRLADLLPDEAPALLREAAGIAERELDDGALALADLRRLFEVAPDDGEALEWLERLLRQAGLWDEVAELLQSRASDPAVALRLAALRRDHLGDPEGALGLYASHLDQPAATGALEAWVRSGAPGAIAAMDLLDPALEDPGRRVELRELLLAGDLPDGDRTGLLDGLRALHEEQGAPELAFVAACRLFAHDHEAAAAHVDRLGRATGSFDELAEIYEEAAEASDDPAPWLASAAAIHEVERGETQLAIATWRKVLQTGGLEDEALEALARLHRAAGQGQALVEVLTRRAARAADDEAAFGFLLEAATAAEELGEAEAAFGAARQAFALHPGDGALLERLSLLAESTRAFDVLVETLEQAVGAGGPVALLRRVARLHDERLEAPAAAIATWERLLSLDETEEEAAAELHRLLRRAERWEELHGICLRRAASAGGEGAAFLREAAGIAERELRDGALAAADWRQVAEVLPGDAQAFRELARLYGEQERWDDQAFALEGLCGAVDGPAALEAKLTLAQLRRRLGAIEVALELAEAILGEAPDHVETRLWLTAWSHEQVEGAPQAFARLDAALVATDDREARIELRQGRLAAAEPGERRGLLEELATLREEGGDPEGAFAATLALFADHPEDAQVRDALCRLADATSSWRELAEAFEAALERLPAGEAAALSLWELLAPIYGERLGRPEAAAEAWEQLAAARPDDDEPLSQLESIYRSRGAHRELCSVLARRAEREAAPERRKDLWFEMASLLEDQLGDREAAIAAYREILTIDEGDLEAFNLLCRLLGESGSWEELAGRLERQVNVAAERGLEHEAREMRFRLARILQQHTGEVERAVELYRAVLAEQPRHPATLAALEELVRSGDTQGRALAAALLAPIYAEERDWQRHVQMLDAMAATAQESSRRAELHRAAAVVYEEELEAGEMAFLAAGRALAADPDDIENLALCLRIAEAAGDLDEELAAILADAAADCRSDEGRAALHRARARLLDRSGDGEGALQAWAQLRSLLPDDAETLRALALLHGKQGDAEAQLEALRSLLAREEENGRRRDLLLEIATVQEVRKRDLAGAFTSLRRLLEIEPLDVEALSRLDRLCVEQERWIDLADVLEREVQAAAASGDQTVRVEFLHRLASLREARLLDREGGLDLYRQALELAPDHEPTLARLQELLSDESEDLELIGILEGAYRATGDAAQLAELLELRVAATPDSEARKAVLLELATLRGAEQERHDLAFLALSRALREDAADRAVWQRLWQAARAADATEEWLALQDEAAARLDGEALQALALFVAPLCEEHLDDEPRATRWYERAADAPEALAALERLHRTAERWEALADVLERLAEREEDTRERVNLLFRLGSLAEERLQAPERAVAAFRGLLEIDPRHLPTLRALESLHEAAGESRPLYDVLLAQREATPEGSGWQRLALRLAEVADAGLEDPSLAADHYREVLSRNPRHEQAHRGLEALLEREARWTELVELLGARLQSTVDPREIAALHERLGQLRAEHLEDAAGAVESYRSVLERDPRNRRALQALRRIHAERDEGEALAGVLRRLVPLQDDAAGVMEVRLELAEALGALGRRDEAVENGKRVLDLDPRELLLLQRVELLFRDLAAWPEVIRTMEMQAPLLGDDTEALVDLWNGVARLWEEELHRREGAAAALERILELRLDVEAFERLRSIYRDVADWRRYAQATERFASACDDVGRKVELLRELGEVHESRLGQRELAFARLGAAFELAPGDEAIRAHLANLAADGGMHEELALIYESVIDAWEDDPASLPLLLELGRLQDGKLDDPEEAEASLRRILDREPGHQEALEALAGLFSRRGADRELLQILERQLETTAELEGQRELLHRMAKVAEERIGDAGEAARALERALHLDPAHAETREALASLYRRAGRLREVAALLGRSRELATESGERYELQVRLAALLEGELDDDEGAIAAWALAHEIDGNRLEPLDALERLFTTGDRWSDLLRVYDRKIQLIEGGEERCRLHLKAANIHEEQLGNLARAIEALDGARAAAPANRVALRELGRLLRAAGDRERLIEVTEAHLAVLGDDAAAAAERVELQVRLGELRWQVQQDAAGAEAAWLHALEIDGRARSALAALGRHFERQGAWQRALEMIGREAALLGSSPDARELHLRAGRIHREELDDAAAAEAAWRAALAIDEAWLPALQALRDLHRARGEREAFLDVLTRLATHTQEPAEKTRLWNEVGSCHLEREEEEQAIRAYEEARRHTPDDLDAALALGDRYYAREDWPRAEAALDVVCSRLARDGEGDADALRTRAHKLYRLGSACERQGKNPKALQAYGRAWESDPGLLGAGEGLARLLVAAGDDAQALRVYQAILIHHRDELSDPELVELHFAIGEIRHRLGERDAALKSFRSALELDSWHIDSHRAVIDLAEEEGDLALALAHRQKLTEFLEGDEKRSLLLETAAMATERLDDPWEAIDAYVAALRLQPDDLETADKLLALYRQTRQGAKVVDLIERLLASDPVLADPKLQILLRTRLGDHFRGEAGADPDAAASAVAHYNAALDLDWRQTAAFEALEALLAEREDWRQLESNYVRMLERLPREEASRPFRVLLYRTLADLYRNALQDLDAAAEAWKAVAVLAPGDGEAAWHWADLVTRKPGAELEAIDAWRKALPVVSDVVGAARALERLHARRRTYDAAFVAASVVADLYGEGGSDEGGILDKLRPFASTRASGAIAERHWADIAHEGVRGPVAQIFALIQRHAASLLAADHEGVPVQGRMISIDRKRDRVDLEGMLYLAGVYKRSCAALGVQPPELYKVAQVSGVHIANTLPTCLVAGEEMFAQQASRRQLAYLFGSNLAYSRPELALARFHAAPQLEVLLQAAVLLGEPRFKRTADAEAVEKVRRKLAKILPPDAVRSLQAIAYGYARDRKRQTVDSYLQAAELTANRVGALLAGDLAVARHQLVAEESAIPLDERLRDVAAFALSAGFGDLRKALGLAVQIPA